MAAIQMIAGHFIMMIISSTWPTGSAETSDPGRGDDTAAISGRTESRHSLSSVWADKENSGRICHPNGTLIATGSYQVCWSAWKLGKLNNRQGWKKTLSAADELLFNHATYHCALCLPTQRVLMKGDVIVRKARGMATSTGPEMGCQRNQAGKKWICGCTCTMRAVRNVKDAHSLCYSRTMINVATA